MGPSDVLDSQSIFTGACKKCGECYEARSGVEDLEGITFACKKMHCDGKVSLSAHGVERPNDDQTPPVSPRRFC